MFLRHREAVVVIGFGGGHVGEEQLGDAKGLAAEFGDGGVYSLYGILRVKQRWNELLQAVTSQPERKLGCGSPLS